ncbi:MAG: hypothetical protein PHW04_09135 [Candidatus Wallbacteria bacterium]|nr:hypothetical protein [Candidatus Wallbacteria bacterium]
MRAFTIVEILVTMILLSLALLPISLLFSTGVQSGKEVEGQMKMRMLAEDLMQEILSKSFDDPESILSIGLEEAATIETVVDRRRLDDVDDYSDYDDLKNIANRKNQALPMSAEVYPISANGEKLTQYSGMRRQVKVMEADGITPLKNTGFVRTISLPLGFTPKKSLLSRYASRFYVMNDNLFKAVNLGKTKLDDMIETTISGTDFQDFVLSPTDNELYLITSDSIEIYAIPSTDRVNLGLHYQKIAEISSNFTDGTIEAMITEADTPAFSCGNLWIHYDGGTNFRKMLPVFPDMITCAYYAPDEGKTYFGTRTGLCDESRKVICGSTRVNQIFKDLRNQRLYFCTEGEGIFVRRDGVFQNIGSASGLPDPTGRVNVRSLALDEYSGYLYAATDLGAYFSVDGGQHFELIRLPSGVMQSADYSNIALYYADRKRYLALARADQNLMIFRELTLPGTIANLNPFATTASLAMCTSHINRFKNSGQSLYVCSDQGMFTIQKTPAAWEIKQSSTKYDSRNTGLASANVRDFAGDSCGRNWLATSKGMAVDSGNGIYSFFPIFSKFRKLVLRDNWYHVLQAVDEAGRIMEVDTFSKRKIFRCDGTAGTIPGNPLPRVLKDVTGNSLAITLSTDGAKDYLDDGSSTLQLPRNYDRVYRDPSRRYVYCLSKSSERISIFNSAERYLNEFNSYDGFEEYVILDTSGTLGGYNVGVESSTLPASAGNSVLKITSDRKFRGWVWCYREFNFQEETRTIEVGLNFLSRFSQKGTQAACKLWIYGREIAPSLDLSSAGQPDFGKDITLDSVETGIIILPAPTQRVTVAIGCRDIWPEDGLSIELDRMTVDFDRSYSPLQGPFPLELSVPNIQNPISLSFGVNPEIVMVIYKDSNYRLGVFYLDTSSAIPQLLPRGSVPMESYVSNPMEILLSPNGRRIFILDGDRLVVFQLVPVRKTIRVSVSDLMNAASSPYVMTSTMSYWRSQNKGRKLPPLITEDPEYLTSNPNGDYYYPYRTYIYDTDLSMTGGCYNFRGPLAFKSNKGKSISFQNSELISRSPQFASVIFSSYNDVSCGYSPDDADPSISKAWPGLRIGACSLDLPGILITHADENIITDLYGGTLRDISLQNNVIGLRIANGDFTFKQAEFAGNLSGLVFDTGKQTIENSVFRDNREAISQKAGTLHLYGAGLIRNYAGLSLFGTDTADSCSFLNNTTGLDDQGSIHLAKCFFGNNTAGINCSRDGQFSGSFNLFYGNTTAIDHSGLSIGSSALPVFVYNYFNANHLNLQRRTGSGRVFARYSFFNGARVGADALVKGEDQQAQAESDIQPLALSGCVNGSATYPTADPSDPIPTVILDYVLQETGEIKIPAPQLIEFFPGEVPGIFTSNGSLRIEGTSTSEVVFTTGTDQIAGKVLPLLSPGPKNGEYTGIVLNGWDELDICKWARFRYGVLEIHGHCSNQENFYYNRLETESKDDLKLVLSIDDGKEANLKYNYWGRNVPDFSKVLSAQSGKETHIPWAYAGTVEASETWPCYNYGAAIISTIEAALGKQIQIDAGTGETLIKFGGDYAVENSDEIIITGNKNVIFTSKNDSQPPIPPESVSSDLSLGWWGSHGINAAPFAGIGKIKADAGKKLEFRYGCLNTSSFSSFKANSSLAFKDCFLFLNETLINETPGGLLMQRCLVKGSGSGGDRSLMTNMITAEVDHCFFTSADDNDFDSVETCGLTGFKPERFNMPSAAGSAWGGLNLGSGALTCTESIVKKADTGISFSAYSYLNFSGRNYLTDDSIGLNLTSSAVPTTITGLTFLNDKVGIRLHSADNLNLGNGTAAGANSFLYSQDLPKGDKALWALSSKNLVVAVNLFGADSFDYASSSAFGNYTTGLKCESLTNPSFKKNLIANYQNIGACFNSCQSVEVALNEFDNNGIALEIVDGDRYLIGHTVEVGEVSNKFSGNGTGIKTNGGTGVRVIYNKFENQMDQGIDNNTSPTISGNLFTANKAGIISGGGQPLIILNDFNNNPTGVKAEMLYDAVGYKDRIIRSNNFRNSTQLACQTSGGDVEFNRYTGNIGNQSGAAAADVANFFSSDADRYLQLPEGNFLTVTAKVFPGYTSEEAGIDLYPEGQIPTMEVALKLHTLKNSSSGPYSTSLLVASYDDAGSRLDEIEFELKTSGSAGSEYEGLFEVYDINGVRHGSPSIPALKAKKKGHLKFVWLPMGFEQPVDSLETQAPNQADLFISTPYDATNHSMYGHNLGNGDDTYYDFDGIVILTAGIGDEPRAGHGTSGAGITTLLTFNVGGDVAATATRLNLSDQTVTATINLTNFPSGKAGVDWKLVTGDPGFLERHGHASVVFKNKMWVIGGYCRAAAGNYLNDVWNSSDGKNWTCITNNAGFPGRDNFTALVFQDRIWVIGGQVASHVAQNDVWWSTNGITWYSARENGEPNGFSARYGHSSVIFDNKMWVIGAESSSGLKNDVWWSDDGTTWSMARDSGTPNGFTARAGHASVVFNDKMWVIGGTTGSLMADAWVSPDGVNWTCVRKNSDPDGFPAMSGQTSVVFGNKMWVIGGSPSTPRNVYYSGDGIVWYQAASPAPFLTENAHTSLVFSGKIWVIGGITDVSPSKQFKEIWCSPTEDSFEITETASNQIGGSSQSDNVEVLLVDPPLLDDRIKLGDMTEGKKVKIITFKNSQYNDPDFHGLQINFIDIPQVPAGMVGFHVAWSHSPDLSDFSSDLVIQPGENMKETPALDPGIYMFKVRAFRKDPQKLGTYEYTAWSEPASFRVEGWYQVALPPVPAGLNLLSCSMADGRVAVLSDRSGGNYYVLSAIGYGDDTWEVFKISSGSMTPTNVKVQDHDHFIVTGYNLSSVGTYRLYQAGLLRPAVADANMKSLLDAELGVDKKYICVGEDSGSNGGICNSLEAVFHASSIQDNIAAWDREHWQTIGNGAERNMLYYHWDSTGDTAETAETVAPAYAVDSPYYSISSADKYNQLVWAGGLHGKLLYSGNFGRTYNTVEVIGIDAPVRGVEFLNFYLGFACLSRKRSDGYQILYSANGGTTWTGQNTPASSWNLNDVEMDPDTDEIQPEGIVRGLAVGDKQTLLLYYGKNVAEPADFPLKPWLFVRNMNLIPPTFQHPSVYYDLDGRNVNFNWDSIPMADKYRLSCNGTGILDTCELFYTVEIPALPVSGPLTKEISDIYRLTELRTGSGSLPSVYSNEIKIVVPMFNPHRVNFFKDVVETCQLLDLSFAQLGDSSLGGANGYRVERTIDTEPNNCPDFMKVFNTSTNLWSDNDSVNQFGLYHYRIFGTSGSGTSLDSIDRFALRNMPPTCDAGPDMGGIENETIHLTGTYETNDAGQDMKTFLWQIVNGELEDNFSDKYSAETDILLKLPGTGSDDSGEARVMFQVQDMNQQYMPTTSYDFRDPNSIYFRNYTDSDEMRIRVFRSFWVTLDLSRNLIDQADPKISIIKGHHGGVPPVPDPILCLPTGTNTPAMTEPDPRFSVILSDVRYAIAGTKYKFSYNFVLYFDKLDIDTAYLRFFSSNPFETLETATQGVGQGFTGNLNFSAKDIQVQASSDPMINLRFQVIGVKNGAASVLAEGVKNGSPKLSEDQWWGFYDSLTPTVYYKGGSAPSGSALCSVLPLVKIHRKSDQNREIFFNLTMDSANPSACGTTYVLADYYDNSGTKYEKKWDKIDCPFDLSDVADKDKKLDAKKDKFVGSRFVYTIYLGNQSPRTYSGVINNLETMPEDVWTVCPLPEGWDSGSLSPYGANTPAAHWVKVSPQGQIWTSRADQVVFVYNNRIYLMGGYDGTTFFNDVYSSADGFTWRRERDNTDDASSWSRRRGFAAYECNGRMFIAGGESSAAPTYKSDIWSTADGKTWTNEGNLPNSNCQHNVFWLNGKLYLTSGYDNVVVSRVYDSTDGKNWTLRTSNPGWAARCWQSAVAFDPGSGTKAWLLGGWPGTPSGMLYASDSPGTDNSWNRVSLSEVLGHKIEEQAMVVFDGKIWVLGGFDGSSCNSEVWSSKDGSNWQLATSKPGWSPRSRLAAATFSNRIWIFCGFDNSWTSNPTNDIWHSPPAISPPMTMACQKSNWDTEQVDFSLAPHALDCGTFEIILKGQDAVGIGLGHSDWTSEIMTMRPPKPVFASPVPAGDFANPPVPLPTPTVYYTYPLGGSRTYSITFSLPSGPWLTGTTQYSLKTFPSGSVETGLMDSTSGIWKGSQIYPNVTSAPPRHDFSYIVKARRNEIDSVWSDTMAVRLNQVPIAFVRDMKPTLEMDVRPVSKEVWTVGLIDDDTEGVYTWDDTHFNWDQISGTIPVKPTREVGTKLQFNFQVTTPGVYKYNLKIKDQFYEPNTNETWLKYNVYDMFHNTLKITPEITYQGTASVTLTKTITGGIGPFTDQTNYGDGGGYKTIEVDEPSFKVDVHNFSTLECGTVQVSLHGFDCFGPVPNHQDTSTVQLIIRPTKPLWDTPELALAPGEKLKSIGTAEIKSFYFAYLGSISGNPKLKFHEILTVLTDTAVPDLHTYFQIMDTASAPYGTKTTSYTDKMSPGNPWTGFLSPFNYNNLPHAHTLTVKVLRNGQESFWSDPLYLEVNHIPTAEVIIAHQQYYLKGDPAGGGTNLRQYLNQDWPWSVDVSDDDLISSYDYPSAFTWEVAASSSEVAAGLFNRGLGVPLPTGTSPKFHFSNPTSSVYKFKLKLTDPRNEQSINRNTMEIWIYNDLFVTVELTITDEICADTTPVTITKSYSGGLEPVRSPYLCLPTSDNGSTADPTSAWTQSVPKGAPWSSRYNFGCTVFNGKIWVAGGRTDGGSLNDIYSSADGMLWEKVYTSGQIWGPREGMIFVGYKGKLWVIGGDDGTRKNDIWSSADGVTWQQSGSTFPQLICNTVCLEYAGVLYIIGGFGTTGAINDVYMTTDGEHWNNLPLTDTYPMRNKHRGVVYNDGGGDKMWISGGATPFRNDVYSSTDGADWNTATNGAGWDVREGHAMINYNGKMWVMGGHKNGYSTMYNDLWYSTNGSAWTESGTKPGWSGRALFGAVVFRNRIWVLGGYNGSNSLSDIWYCGTTLPATSGQVSYLSSYGAESRSFSYLDCGTYEFRLKGDDYYATLYAPTTYQPHHDEDAKILTIRPPKPVWDPPTTSWTTPCTLTAESTYYFPYSHPTDHTQNGTVAVTLKFHDDLAVLTTPETYFQIWETTSPPAAGVKTSYSDKMTSGTPWTGILTPWFYPNGTYAKTIHDHKYIVKVKRNSQESAWSNQITAEINRIPWTLLSGSPLATSEIRTIETGTYGTAVSFEVSVYDDDMPLTNSAYKWDTSHFVWTQIEGTTKELTFLTKPKFQYQDSVGVESVCRYKLQIRDQYNEPSTNETLLTIVNSNSFVVTLKLSDDKVFDTNPLFMDTTEDHMIVTLNKTHTGGVKPYSCRIDYRDGGGWQTREIDDMNPNKYPADPHDFGTFECGTFAVSLNGWDSLGKGFPGHDNTNTQVLTIQPQIPLWDFPAANLAPKDWRSASSWNSGTNWDHDMYYFTYPNPATSMEVKLVFHLPPVMRSGGGVTYEVTTNEVALPYSGAMTFEVGDYWWEGTQSVILKNPPTHDYTWEVRARRNKVASPWSTKFPVRINRVPDAWAINTGESYTYDHVSIIAGAGHTYVWSAGSKDDDPATSYPYPDNFVWTYISGIPGYTPTQTGTKPKFQFSTDKPQIYKYSLQVADQYGEPSLNTATAVMTIYAYDTMDVTLNISRTCEIWGDNTVITLNKFYNTTGALPPVGTPQIDYGYGAFINTAYELEDKDFSSYDCRSGDYPLILKGSDQTGSLAIPHFDSSSKTVIVVPQTPVWDAPLSPKTYPWQKNGVGTVYYYYSYTATPYNAANTQNQVTLNFYLPAPTPGAPVGAVDGTVRQAGVTSRTEAMTVETGVWKDNQVWDLDVASHVCDMYVKATRNTKVSTEEVQHIYVNHVPNAYVTTSSGNKTQDVVPYNFNWSWQLGVDDDDLISSYLPWDNNSIKWTQLDPAPLPMPPNVTIGFAAGQKCTFTAPTAGTYAYRLQVKDPDGELSTNGPTYTIYAYDNISESLSLSPSTITCSNTSANVQIEKNSTGGLPDLNYYLDYGLGSGLQLNSTGTETKNYFNVDCNVYTVRWQTVDSYPAALGGPHQPIVTKTLYINPPVPAWKDPSGATAKTISGTPYYYYVYANGGSTNITVNYELPSTTPSNTYIPSMSSQIRINGGSYAANVMAWDGTIWKASKTYSGLTSSPTHARSFDVYADRGNGRTSSVITIPKSVFINQRPWAQAYSGNDNYTIDDVRPSTNKDFSIGILDDDAYTFIWDTSHVIWKRESGPGSSIPAPYSSPKTCRYNEPIDGTQVFSLQVKDPYDEPSTNSAQLTVYVYNVVSIDSWSISPSTIDASTSATATMSYSASGGIGGLSAWYNDGMGGNVGFSSPLTHNFGDHDCAVYTIRYHVTDSIGNSGGVTTHENEKTASLTINPPVPEWTAPLGPPPTRTVSGTPYYYYVYLEGGSATVTMNYQLPSGTPGSSVIPSMSSKIKINGGTYASTTMSWSGVVWRAAKIYSVTSGGGHARNFDVYADRGNGRTSGTVNTPQDIYVNQRPQVVAKTVKDDVNAYFPFNVTINDDDSSFTYKWTQIDGPWSGFTTSQPFYGQFSEICGGSATNPDAHYSLDATDSPAGETGSGTIAFHINPPAYGSFSTTGSEVENQGTQAIFTIVYSCVAGYQTMYRCSDNAGNESGWITRSNSVNETWTDPFSAGTTETFTLLIQGWYPNTSGDKIFHAGKAITPVAPGNNGSFGNIPTAPDWTF